MSSNIPWLRTRASKTKLVYHCIFVVKYRRKALSDSMLAVMEAIFSQSCRELNCTLHEFNGESDHVHFLVQAPPTLAISTLVKCLKGRSSRQLRLQFRRELKPFLWGKNLWSPSYCVVSCGGATIETIRRYIEDQDRPA